MKKSSTNSLGMMKTHLLDLVETTIPPESSGCDLSRLMIGDEIDGDGSGKTLDHRYIKTRILPEINTDYHKIYNSSTRQLPDL